MEDIRKCEKCGADIDINDIYCPECGAEQPVRFHYEAYETPRFDRVIGGDFELDKRKWLKEILYEAGVLTLSNQVNDVWSAPLASYDGIVVTTDENSQNVISIDGNLDGRAFSIRVGGVDLYPQDWKHIEKSLQQLGIPLQAGDSSIEGRGGWRVIVICILLACAMVGVLLLLGF